MTESWLTFKHKQVQAWNTIVFMWNVKCGCDWKRSSLGKYFGQRLPIPLKVKQGRNSVRETRWQTINVSVCHGYFYYFWWISSLFSLLYHTFNFFKQFRAKYQKSCFAISNWKLEQFISIVKVWKLYFLSVWNYFCNN